MNVAGSTKDTAHELKNISGVEIRSQVTRSHPGICILNFTRDALKALFELFCKSFHFQCDSPPRLFSSCQFRQDTASKCSNSLQAPHRTQFAQLSRHWHGYNRLHKKNENALLALLRWEKCMKVTIRQVLNLPCNSWKSTSNNKTTARSLTSFGTTCFNCILCACVYFKLPAIFLASVNAPLSGG